ncbi:cytochrome P450 [Massariosphaeria phaeospora]|uniref:Cytochrome P450 n=1 Tax=Massariosphaeria phaeospora TaxID=100035 RepID=A0A7C8MV09_9PLEO|nr:cytochrome P450 [Massariosphaeria phaeospora]
MAGTQASFDLIHAISTGKVSTQEQDDRLQAQNIAKQARQVLLEKDTVKITQQTILQQILSSNLLDSEKTPPHLIQNGALVISAGTVSTAWALTVGAFYVLNEPHVLQRLQTELVAAMPDRSADIGIVQLIGTVAISCGMFSDRATSKTWHIPSGTPMSMSHVLLNRDESIFPDHRRFKPERWLDNPTMNRYQFAWSKGTRNCIGINLAMAEMTCVFAGISRHCESRNGLKISDHGVRTNLFKTTVRDVEMVVMEVCLFSGLTPKVYVQFFYKYKCK